MELKIVKKWIVISSIILVALVGFFANVLFSSIKPLNRAEDWATNVAKEEASIQTVQDFSIYNGTKTYYIVTGIDTNGEELIVWIPEKDDRDGKIVIRKKKEGISQDDAIKRLYGEKDVQVDEIIHVKLGMENQIPLWEIFYRSNDLINYYYVDFKSGEWLKHIKNL